MVFTVDPLPYPHGALAPKGISEEQVMFHYEKHHKGYAAKLNAAAETNKELAKKSLLEIIRTEKGPAFNSAAQIFNHNFYWKCMSPNGGGQPTGRIAKEIDDSFGSFAKFKEEFTTAANGHFGSGWAWLVKDTNTNKLKVYQTHDANTPITEDHLKPILTADVWEHAYYVDYRNDRAAYVNAWWNVVNWKFANERLQMCTDARRPLRSDL